MKMIVGLGNVGREYAETRHNVGFALVELLAISLGHKPADFRPHNRAKADILDLGASHGLLLVKPTTMMNLSGEAIGALARFYKIDAVDIWVAYDEVDIPFGMMRIAHDGSSAGHNGVKSIIKAIGSDFWRVRVGVRNARFPVMPTDAFVLSRFDPDEASKMTGMLGKASHIIETAVVDGTLTAGDTNLAA